LDNPLAAVSANHNGIAITSNHAGSTLLIGPGAGALPTASAVLADLVDLATGRYQATASRFSFFTAGADVPLLPERDELTGSYARFAVTDRRGVLAAISTVLSEHGVSLRSLRQADVEETGLATIEIITHQVLGGSFLKAIEYIDRSGLTVGPTVVYRRL
jgi:homoserine dehydrogenase